MTKPDVIISYDAYRKLAAYINNVANEVGGIGHISRAGNFIHVNDVFLIEQVVTGASTNLSPEGMAKFYQERLAKDPTDDMSGYKLWWHSHYNMGVFWSNTDDTTIDSFDQECDTNNFMLSIVGNQKGELKVRLDVYSPFRYTFDNIDYIIGPDNSGLEDEIKKEIAEKVKNHADNYKKEDKINTKSPLADIDKYDEEYPWNTPDDWDTYSKKEKKMWRRLAKKDIQPTKHTWVSARDGKRHTGIFNLPCGSVIYRIDDDDRAIYIRKHAGETDHEARVRWSKSEDERIKKIQND